MMCILIFKSSPYLIQEKQELLKISFKEQDVSKMLDNEMKEIYFIGASGQYYPFKFFTLSDKLPEMEAVYIFTKVGNGLYDSLYIGQTTTLKSTIANHEKWVCVNRLLVNAVCVNFEKDTKVREQITKDLIEIQCPPCND